MKRSINNNTLLRSTTNQEYSITKNYCPLPIKNTQKNREEVELNQEVQELNQEAQELNQEAQELLRRYKELVTELNKIRGKLYINGIDPDKY